MIRQRAAGVEPGPRKAREPVVTYDQAVIEVLVRCWSLLDGPTGKRLQPALPQLLDSLRTHGRLDATADHRGPVTDVTGHHRPAPAALPGRTGRVQRHEPHPPRIDAEGQHPDEDLGRVGPHRTRLRPDRPGW